MVFLTTEAILIHGWKNDNYRCDKIKKMGKTFN